MNIYSAKTKEQMQTVKENSKLKFGGLYQELNNLFFNIDPFDLNYESNLDEYESEVCALLPELHPNIKSKEIYESLIKVCSHFFGRQTIEEAVPKLKVLATKIEHISQTKTIGD
jgi:hypothetical protein